MSKVLVTYYSWSGNTKKVAEALAQQIGADLVALTVPLDTFSKDMYETNDQANEQLAKNRLPELSNFPENLAAYDTIFIGGPVWSGKPATPLLKFFELLPNKPIRVVPFYTSAGQSEEYEENFKKTLKSNLLVANGFEVRSNELDTQQIHQIITTFIKK